MDRHELGELLKEASEGVPGIVGDACLDDGELSSMAVSGGLDRVSDEALKHLCLCESCRSRWLSWRKALGGDFGEAFEAKAWDSLLLHAASSAESAPGANPVEYTGERGVYRITLHPSAEGLDMVLVVVDFLSEEARLSAEGRMVEVTDAGGSTLLRGRVVDGHVARPYEGISGADLSELTVSFAGMEENS
jgi:hypothetical protein